MMKFILVVAVILLSAALAQAQTPEAAVGDQQVIP